MCFITPTHVYGRKGTPSENEKGVCTGGEHRCALEGCRGHRIAVRWSDGKHTFPCTKGMDIRSDGQYQIL